MLTLTQEPGVELAKFPAPLTVSSRPGEVVEGEQPWTGEQASFTWRLTSPVSIHTLWLGNNTGLAEASGWVFYPTGVQVNILYCN